MSICFFFLSLFVLFAFCYCLHFSSCFAVCFFFVIAYVFIAVFVGGITQMLAVNLLLFSDVDD